MLTTLIASVAATAIGAFSEGVCAALASYSIAKYATGKVNINFKK